MKILAIVILAGLGIAAGLDYYRNDQIERFCSGISVGSDVSLISGTETFRSLKPYVVQGPGAFRYGFSAYLLRAGVCEVTVADEKVTGTRFYHHERH